jgi:hypothetical protein
MLILNAGLDVAIVAALTFVMSRAGKLTPHRVGVEQAAHTRPTRAAAARGRAGISPLRPQLG